MPTFILDDGLKLVIALLISSGKDSFTTVQSRFRRSAERSLQTKAESSAIREAKIKDFPPGAAHISKIFVEFSKILSSNFPFFILSNVLLINFKTFSDPTKPHFTLRNIKTGEEIKTRIRQSKLYRENPFGEFAILDIKGFTYVHKKKNVGGLSEHRAPQSQGYEAPSSGWGKFGLLVGVGALLAYFANAVKKSDTHRR